MIVIMMTAFGLEGNRCWGCMNQEKAALLHLKALFKVAQHDSLSSWTDDEKSDCCDGWEGVTCGPNGRVFSLSLSPSVTTMHGMTMIQASNCTSMPLFCFLFKRFVSLISLEMECSLGLRLKVLNCRHSLL